MLDLYLDGDGCPVKDETCKVAKRYQLTVYVVSNRPIFVPSDARIVPVRVKARPDEADHWIAERAGLDDVVVTADIPLAARALEKGAWVLAPRGEPFSRDTIGEKLAMRELMNELRDMGAVSGGPPPMAARDRSRYLQRLDQTIQAIRRAPDRSPS
ncbi:MAG: YaiI/YqxD family protein [Deltaproteobacteria bacterium]|nr:YaiI/YqxD family protein [Deltaproteobacteria bacterium]